MGCIQSAVSRNEWHPAAHTTCRHPAWPTTMDSSTHPTQPNPNPPTHQIDIPRALQRCLRHAWSLWEKALTADPLLILAPTPAEAAEAVAAVVSLVAPLPYCADFRPYLCIHDPAFEALLQAQRQRQKEGRHAGGCGGALALGGGVVVQVAGGGGSGNGGGGAAAGGDAGDKSSGNKNSKAGGAAECPVLLGVTNTHFITSLTSFPNVLSVGEKAGAPPPPSAASLLYPPNAIRALRRRQQGAAALLSHHTQDLWSVGRGLVRPDGALLPAGAAAGGASSPAVARQLRRHFGQLTSAFLVPFSQYLEPGADGTVSRC